MLAELSEQRVTQLTHSLIADARQQQQQQQHVDNLEQVSAVYLSMQEKAERVPGYPYLYRQAWLLLLRALHGEHHWQTLHDIDSVFQLAFPSDEQARAIDNALREQHFVQQGTAQSISVWHLKAVLYAWSRLPGGGGGVLNNRDRAAELLGLLNACQAFVNLSPQEAAVKLVRASLDQHYSGPGHQSAGGAQPYLFRLSTTEPGAISLSFLGPVSQQVVHHRLRSNSGLVEAYARTTNLYATLVDEAVAASQRTGDPNGDMIDGTGLLLALRKIDPHANPQQLSRIMQQRQGGRAVERRHVYRELKRLFFPGGLITQQLAPLSAHDMAGVTDSYRDSYVSLSSLHSFYAPLGLLENVTAGTMCCFNDACGSPELTHKDPLSNRLYCSRPECYQLDCIVKCF